jgi:hypothetical protein
LSEAEHIFVIGYSLPTTDEFFKYFYALGSVGSSIPTLFSVVNPDSGIAKRFKLIVGPTAASPNCLRPVLERFDAAIPFISTELRSPAE